MWFKVKSFPLTFHNGRTDGRTDNYHINIMITGGVNWFTIGQLMDSVDENRVLEKLQNVIYMLDHNQPPVSNIDSATRILEKV